MGTDAASEPWGGAGVAAGRGEPRRRDVLTDYPLRPAASTDDTPEDPAPGERGGGEDHSGWGPIGVMWFEN